MEFLSKLSEWWDTPKNLDEKMKGLKRKLDVLNALKEDMESSRTNQLHPKKKQKKEVDLWFTNVENIDKETEDLEKEIDESNFLLRGFHKGNVLKKIQEVGDLYQQGKSHDSLVVVNSRWSGPIPAAKLIGGAAENCMTDIWASLMDDGIGKIGVWGMGGVGKTTIMEHIHNKLLEGKGFDKVIWVTISQEFNIVKIQDDIARELNLMGCLQQERDTFRRRKFLFDMLKKANKHVLILDDVWDEICLEEVGIPEPISSNGCKLVLTTRKERVCKFIGCDKVIKVNPLSEEDALALFLKKVGPVVSQSPTLLSKSKLVVEECAGLPLTIIVVAGTLKGEDNPRIWDNALNELKWRIGEVVGVDAKVIKCLKFSFDHLKDEEVKHCFLYCAFYPEDFEILKDEVIESWIDEGFIDEMDARQQMIDKGHAILKKLEDNSLLEIDRGRRYVKMHDAVRDMALSIITSMNPPLYMIKTGIQLESLPKEEEWAEDIEKVSLMWNSISEIPIDLSPPKCLLLTALLLQHNPIRSIPDSFFANMPCLSVLNLSWTEIECLPNSISELKNLTALLLQHCTALRHLPSVSKLQELKKLDLYASKIEGFPEGMEMLVNLRYLDLSYTEIEEVSAGVLPKLSRLQHLRLEASVEGSSIKAEEVVPLQKLESFVARFKDINELKKFVQSMHCKKSLNTYHLQVGYHFLPDEEDKVVIIRQSESCGDEILLPIDVQQLAIGECHSLKSLSDISCLKNAMDLKDIRIGFCKGIESVLSISSFSSSSILFQRLKHLRLVDLPRLSEVIKVEGFGSARSPILAPPAATFSHLKKFCIFKCSNIKKLFLHWLLTNLQNLEMIYVGACEKLEEILAVATSEDDDEEKRTDKIKVNLPNLRQLRLHSLPELKSICIKSGVMVCDSLQWISIRNCSKLNRIPPFLPRSGNGQPYTYTPPSLKIESSREWWESLEWDHPDFKNLLQPLWHLKEK